MLKKIVILLSMIAVYGCSVNNPNNDNRSIEESYWQLVEAFNIYKVELYVDNIYMVTLQKDSIKPTLISYPSYYKGTISSGKIISYGNDPFYRESSVVDTGTFVINKLTGDSLYITIQNRQKVLVRN
jgi:hypothetical protein